MKVDFYQYFLVNAAGVELENGQLEAATENFVGSIFPSLRIVYNTATRFIFLNNNFIKRHLLAKSSN